jgi:hypothetical protein
MPVSYRWFSVAYGLWLFGVLAYFVPAATWNPVSHFDLTRAIVEQRTLSIDAYADNTGDRALAGGRWYTEKAPVPSLLAVPAYAVLHAYQKLRGQAPDYTVLSTAQVPARRVLVNSAFQQGLYVCALSTSGIGTALVGVLLFHVLRRRFTPEAALFGSASVVLGTPLLPYGTSFYGHAVAAAFLIAAFAALFLDEALPAREPSRKRVRLAGVALGLAAGSEYLAVVPGLVLVLVWLATRRRAALAQGVVDLSLGALGPVAVVSAYHHACFGAPWRTGYAFVVRPEFAAGHASGLMGLHLPSWDGLVGLLVGESRGLLYLSPLAAMALVGAVFHAFRTREPASIAGVLAFAALLLVNSGYYMWWGGAAAGPRHLVPAVGFLAFGAAACWRFRVSWLVAGLAAISTVHVLVLTLVGLEAPERGDLLLDYAYARLARGEVAVLSGASNLGLRLGLAPAATLGPVLVWLLLGGRYLVRQLRASEPSDVELSSAEHAPVS